MPFRLVQIANPRPLSLLTAVLACVAIGTAMPAAGHAAPVQTFSTSQSEFDPGVRNQGWWSFDAGNHDDNFNYIAGGGDSYRNFFTFDLSSACVASGITLQLTRFEQTGSGTYSLFNVSTPAATLNANDGINQTIFDDLGSGTSLGSFPVAPGAPETILSFPLNAAGVAAFNAARGGFFSIGGSAVVSGPGYPGWIFGASDNPGTQELVVTCASASWVSPKDGQTGSGLLTEVAADRRSAWRGSQAGWCDTENYVDGKLNDTQVFHPWGCVWDTRNYVNGGHLLTVKAYDAASNLIAEDTIRVTVNNPNPPPVSKPPPPLIETSPGVVMPSGSTGSQPTNPAPRFTRKKARRAIKRALALRYGKVFRERKGYTATCLKPSASRWSCAVRWRYGQFAYKGKIKLTLRSDGRIASKFVLRKTTP